VIVDSRRVHVEIVVGAVTLPNALLASLARAGNLDR
jgi:hypothetical protein